NKYGVNISDAENEAIRANVAARLRILGVQHADELAALGAMPDTQGLDLVKTVHLLELNTTGDTGTRMLDRAAFLTAAPRESLSRRDGTFTRFTTGGVMEVVVGGRVYRASPDAVQGLNRLLGVVGPRMLDPGTTEVVNLVERRF